MTLSRDQEEKLIEFALRVLSRALKFPDQTHAAYVLGLVSAELTLGDGTTRWRMERAPWVAAAIEELKP